MKISVYRDEAIALPGFIGYTVWSRANIRFWGRRSALLLAYGLVVCCFAAARDGDAGVSERIGKIYLKQGLKYKKHFV